MSANQISSYITKENITFILASIGAVGTITGSIIAFVGSRRNIYANLIDANIRFDTITLFIEIKNRSSLPICISSVSIIIDSVSYPCELLPKKVIEFSGILHRTPYFPLNIAPKTGRSYFLEFLDVPEISSAFGTIVSFAFDTNRGIVNKELCLPRQGCYLHKK